eukprot:230545-Chlamydomonas_euryale.AAC.2
MHRCFPQSRLDEATAMCRKACQSARPFVGCSYPCPPKQPHLDSTMHREKRKLRHPPHPLSSTGRKG